MKDAGLDSDLRIANFNIRDTLHLQSCHVKAEGFIKAQLALFAFAALRHLSLLLLVT